MPTSRIDCAILVEPKALLLMRSLLLTLITEQGMLTSRVKGLKLTNKVAQASGSWVCLGRERVMD